MSRFYNNCVDEASLTTLCPICLDSFQGAKGVRVRRADPKQKIKDVCTYCQIRYGFDYYVQPDKNAGQYVKRGHFDDESESCSSTTVLVVPTICPASGDEHDSSQPKIFAR